MDPVPIAREIRELRHGRGTDAEDLPERVGPGLRVLCGITDTDDANAVRHKLLGRLNDTLDELPPDLALAASWALALAADAREPFLSRRIERLARRFDRDPRTVRRYVDKAIDGMARRLVEGGPPGPGSASAVRDSWQVLTLSSVLRLDRDPPELVEVRRIMATAESLHELELAASAPRVAGTPDDQQIEMTALYGGDIVERVHYSGEHTRFVLRLPEPLRFGQQHEYSVRITSWELATMRPYYVLTPLRPTGTFTLKVGFDRERLPARIWKVTGIPPPWVVDSAQPKADVLEIDEFGEVSAEFEELRVGLSYGLQWSP